MSDHEIQFPRAPSAMNEEEFVEYFGAVYENSPWIAQDAWDEGLGPRHDTVDGLATALAAIVDKAGRKQQLELIRAHPDLAGRTAVQGDVTEESSSEQRSAGIDQCTPAEFARFQNYNERYKRRFGFPFVMAVKGSNRQAILAAFEERVQNDPPTEFLRALQEIHKIAKRRLVQKTVEQNE